MLIEECIAKGTQVIYVAKPVDDGCSRNWQRWLMNNKISWKEIDGSFHIETFVAGDTDELGLSLLSLDNPGICFLEAAASNAKYLNNARRQIHTAGTYIKYNYQSSDAVCQYK